MKKHCLPILLGLFWIVYCPAQNLYPLDTATDSFHIRVVAAQNRLALEWLDRAANGARKRDFMTVTDIRLDDADLVLTYAPEKVKKDFLLSVGISLRTDEGGEIFEPKANETVESDAPGGKQITLLDGTERTLELGRTYTLYVRKSLLGPVACDKPRPVFTVAKQLPYYGVAVVGGVFMGFAALYATQSTDANDNYTRLWKEGEPGGQDSEAARFLTKAQDKKKAARICGWTGAAILAADAFFYGKKWFRFREKQRIYDKFCGKKPAELGIVPNGLGVGLAYKF